MNALEDRVGRIRYTPNEVSIFFWSYPLDSKGHLKSQRLRSPTVPNSRLLAKWIQNCWSLKSKKNGPISPFWLLPSFFHSWFIQSLCLFTFSKQKRGWRLQKFYWSEDFLPLKKKKERKLRYISGSPQKIGAGHSERCLKKEWSSSYPLGAPALCLHVSIHNTALVVQPHAPLHLSKPVPWWSFKSWGAF